MAFCKDCGVQYFNTVAEHEAKCNGGILVFSTNCDYKYDLVEFCKKHKIPYREISCADKWVRDIFFEVAGTQDRLYIRNKNSKHATKRAFSYYNVAISPKDCRSDMDVTTHPRMLDSSHRSINANLFPNDYEIKSTNRALEGGNLFICVNNEGIKYYIIGERVLEYELNLDIQKSRCSGGSLVRRDFQKYIDRYKKIFKIDDNNSKMLILPNLTYHLDLYIAYVDKGTFLINSFSSDAISGASAEAKRSYDAKKKEALEVIQVLERNGFIAQLCTGTIYGDINAERKVWDGSAIDSTLINGINLISNTNGKKYFLTIDTFNLRHKSEIESSLSLFDVTPQYFNYGMFQAYDTQSMVREQAGALRCQTTLISKLSLKEIASIKIQNAMKGYYQKKITRNIFQQNIQSLILFIEALSRHSSRLYAISECTDLKGRHYHQIIKCLQRNQPNQIPVKFLRNIFIAGLKIAPIVRGRNAFLCGVNTLIMSNTRKLVPVNHKNNVSVLPDLNHVTMTTTANGLLNIVNPPNGASLYDFEKFEGMSLEKIRIIRESNIGQREKYNALLKYIYEDIGDDVEFIRDPRMLYQGKDQRQLYAQVMTVIGEIDSLNSH